MKHTQTHKGFTLIETIIYFAIFSIIVSSIIPVFFNFESAAAQINERAAELGDRMFIEAVIRNLLKSGRESEIVLMQASSTLMYQNFPLHGTRLKTTDFRIIKNATSTEYFLQNNFFEGTTTIHTLVALL